MDLDTLFFRSGGFELYQGDCTNILNQFPEESFDLIFADPPYFLSNGGITCKSGKAACVDKGRWDGSHGLNEDFRFNRNWLEACKRILKENGTIWISGTHHNIYQIGFILQKLQFKILNEISWFKPNASPNLSCRYFTHSHETLLWARKNEEIPHFFNYAEMKQWDDKISPAGKQMRSVWHIPTTPKSEKKEGYHPTQKPLELLQRIIKSSSEKEAKVLDPFNGSGTTGIAARMLGRSYVGIDRETEFLNLTVKRLNIEEKHRKGIQTYL